MLSRYKKHFVISLAVFLCLVITQGAALGIQITIDAVADAGDYAGEAAYVRFAVPVVDPNTGIIIGTNYYPVTTSDIPTKWTDRQQVYDYAWYNLRISGWQLESGGNIWSSDLTVGYTLKGLSAGTYRISPEDGAFMYNAFGWDDPYKDKYWWLLNIKDQDDNNYWLGSSTGQNSDALAFNAVKNSFIDIPVLPGGSLSFWIWDWNSIDNSGSLTFSVTSVPEPSTLLLLSIGLIFLMRRSRN